MIQSLLNEFNAGKKKQATLAEPNIGLKRPEPGEILASKDQSKYLSGIRKMIHIMRWSRPDIYNMTFDCVRNMTLAGRTNYNAIIYKIAYCVATPEKYYKFEVTLKIDADYSKCPDTRR